MPKVSELVGKSVVSVDTGERIGKVSDVLVDGQSQHVVGLVLAAAFLGSERVLPRADIQTFGTDAIIARSGSGVMSPGEWHEQPIEATRTSALRDKRVLTTNGRAVGSIRDVLLDETGRVEAFEIVGADLGSILHRRAILPQAPGVTIGEDAVLVPEEAVAALESH